MPQFDKLILFSQVYWLTVLFFILYSLISQMYLPRLSLIFKIRRIVLQDLFGSSADYFLTNIRSNLRSLFVSSVLLTNMLSSMLSILSMDRQVGLTSTICKIVDCYITLCLDVPTISSTVLKN